MSHTSRTVGSALLLVLCSAGLAAAQPHDWTNVRTGPANAQEHAWATGLHASTSGPVRVRRVEFSWQQDGLGMAGDVAAPEPRFDDPDASRRPAPALPRVRGVQARVGDGVEATRLRFESPERALEFATMSNAVFHPGGQTQVVEVRWDQVVLLSGPGLEDPAAAAAARAAAWDRLPVRGESALLAVTRGEDEFVATTAPRGPLYEAAQRAHAESLENQAALSAPLVEGAIPTIRGEWPTEDSAHVWAANFSSTFRQSDDGARVSFASGEANRERELDLERYLQGLEGASQAHGLTSPMLGTGQALEGAANALGRAFGGF